MIVTAAGTIFDSVNCQVDIYTKISNTFCYSSLIEFVPRLKLLETYVAFMEEAQLQREE